MHFSSDNTATGFRRHFTSTTAVPLTRPAELMRWRRTRAAITIRLKALRRLKTAGSAGPTLAAGAEALYNNDSGGYNTASGYEALYSNTNGIYNTAIGFQALYANTSGAFNTAMGEGALSSNTTGTGNTALSAAAALAQDHDRLQ